jgi:hypothetical protein
MKEAFIKAKGLGLSMAPDSFDIILIKDAFLKCIEPKEGYYISVAIVNYAKQNFSTKISEINDLAKLINPFEELP